MRGEGRLAAGELNGELPAGLDRSRVVQELLDVLPFELVNEPDLVGVHEAGVAHHVAAVRQVDREDRPAAVPDRGGPVVVKPVFRYDEVPARIERLEPPEERGVRGHDVLEMSVCGTILLHHDPAAVLFDRGLDLPRVSLDQDLPVRFAREDPGANVFDAAGTKRVGLTGKPELREGTLALFQQRRRRPLRLEGPLRDPPVDGADGSPEDVRPATQRRINRSSHHSCFEVLLIPGAARSPGRLRWILS